MSRFTRFAPTLAAALALATFPATAQAAPAVVTRPAPSTPAYTTQADLDGDGRPDQITISVTRKTDDVWYYAIAVKTARGQRATARLSMGSADELAPKDVWQGAGPVDGAPGSEIRIVESDGGEAWSWQIYSWHNGKLLLQKDPSTGSVNWNDPEPWFGSPGDTPSARSALCANSLSTTSSGVVPDDSPALTRHSVGRSRGGSASARSRPGP